VKPAAVDRRTRFLALLGSGLIRVLGITWRVRYRAAAFDAAQQGRGPVIYMSWHGQMLPMLWAHRNRGISVLISEHRDGELIARIAHSLGFRTVRGSTTRGASRSLIGMTRAIEAGIDVAITPDGPRGPAHSFAPGALYVAQRTGCRLVAVGAAARAWHLKSWDRFAIPVPFARVTVAYAPPLTIPGGDATSFDARAGECTAALHAAVAMAEA
jgi:lysophospholipid acyltransferase (LPLAT)-like uncharacterized protein